MSVLVRVGWSMWYSGTFWGDSKLLALSARQTKLLWWIKLVISYFLPIFIKTEVFLLSFAQAVSSPVCFLTVSLVLCFCRIPYSFSSPREFHVSRSSAAFPSNCLVFFHPLIFPDKVLVWLFSKEHIFTKRRLLTNALIWSQGWPSPKVSHFSPVLQNIYCFPD